MHPFVVRHMQRVNSPAHEHWSHAQNATPESVEKYWLPRCKTFTSEYVCTTYAIGTCECFKKAIHRAFISNRYPQHTYMVQLKLNNIDTHAQLFHGNSSTYNSNHLSRSFDMMTHTVLYCVTLWNSNLGRMQIICDSKTTSCTHFSYRLAHLEGRAW